MSIKTRAGVVGVPPHIRLAKNEQPMVDKEVGIRDLKVHNYPVKVHPAYSVLGPHS